jgi:hypothetical protein
MASSTPKVFSSSPASLTSLSQPLRCCTTLGDIWSFGVVMWEIFSFGVTPYAGMANQEVLEHVVMGYRLTPPENMPAPFVAIMTKCWSANRPTFESMARALRFWAQGGDLSIAQELVSYKPKVAVNKAFDYVRLQPDGEVVVDPTVNRKNPTSASTQQRATVLIDPTKQQRKSNYVFIKVDADQQVPDGAQLVSQPPDASQTDVPEATPMPSEDAQLGLPSSTSFVLQSPTTYFSIPVSTATASATTSEI